ncbi:MAG: hypothetical protein AAB787_02690 [Patescibacteria group bacterium]|mgnify:CR=1 FL=1
MDQNINPNQVPSPQGVPSPSAAPRPQLPGFSELFRYAWMQFRQNWQTLVGIAIIPFALSFVVGLFAFKTPMSFEFVIVYSLAYFLLYILSIISIFLVVTGKVNPPSFSNAYKSSFGFFFSFIWVSILSYLAVFGGTLLLIVPGIIISILLFFPSYSLFTDEKKGLDTLVFSWYYVRNYKLAVIGRLALLGLVMLAVSIVAGIFSFFSSEVSEFLSALISAVYYPIFIIFAFLVYESLQKLSPPPTPEEEEKIRGRVKIFLILGIIAIVAFVGFIYYAISNVMTSSNSDFFNILKEKISQPANEINY